MTKKIIQILSLTSLAILLSACSSFTGIRTPRYDGQPFIEQPDKIAAYAANQEIIGEEKELYVMEPFSEDMLAPSLPYEDHEPVLLEEGTFTVGVDLPASRVTMLGEKDDPMVLIPGSNEDPWAPLQPDEYEVGTMTIRDTDGNFYFENMFHPMYGVMITQVDLIEGHTIEIIGNNPKVVIFYDERLPDDPYIFDTRWEDHLAEIEAQGGTIFEAEEEDDSDAFEGIEFDDQYQRQVLEVSEDGKEVQLNAGIYEIGVHFDPGTYEISEHGAPSYTAIYHFSDQAEPRVYNISTNLHGLYMGMLFNQHPADAEPIVIELEQGDKIYPRYLSHLLLTKQDE